MDNLKQPVRIGVLAVQGAFAEHITILNRFGIEVFEIREPNDLCNIMDGLILPGGESTVQCKLLHELKLFEPLNALIRKGLPVYGTCAGLILLAKQIENDSLDNFGLMDITAVRNAYGRQLGSFTTHEVFASQYIPMSFIRAPYIKSVSPDVEVLSVVDKRIVAARQKNMLVTAFHPEVTDDLTVHQYFLEIIVRQMSTKSELPA